jgi:hypothetical protein
MGRELQRLRRRKDVIQKMDRLLDTAQTALVIHYSCESFYDKTDGKTPRTTSIAVRNLSSGQTESFSIHHIAEERNAPFDQIHDQYDALERAMLDRYFEFVHTRQHYSWIHWNMRDANYGFAAIEHRYRVLGGEPVQIAEDRKFDLARALIDLYAVTYASHPRLESIMKKNKISDRDFMAGPEEARAFAEKQYVKLHQSTLRKVDVLANLFERASSRELRTNSSWREQHGFKPALLAELAKEHWLISLLIAGGGVLTFALRTFDLYAKARGYAGSH